MEWPEPVHADSIGFKKQSLKGRPRKEGQNRYTEGQQEEARRLREWFPFVPSGVTLQAGSRGATSLKAIRAEEDDDPRPRRRRGQDAPRKRWNWQSANTLEIANRLHVGEESAEFFPPTIFVNDAEEMRNSIPVVHSRSRGISPQRRRFQLPQPPAMPLSKEVNEKYSDEEALTKEDANPERDEDPGPAELSTVSERDDNDPVPPGQQFPASIPTSSAPPTDDLRQGIVESITERHSRLRLGDNRNAMATIEYEVAVDSAVYGFETHTLHFLAFAMGEKGNELNISPFRTYPKTLKRAYKMPAFVPSPEASFLCRDRILQISVSNRRRSRYPYICLAVRTETLVYYLLMTPNNTSVFPYPKSNREVQVDLLSIVDTDGLDGAQAVDVCMHPTHFQQCLIATDTGTLYRWSMVRRASYPEGYIHEGKLSRIFTIPDSTRFDVAPRFYRAVWGTREGTVIFLNANHLWFLDLQNPAQLVLNLIDMSRTTSLFTSIDRTANAREAEYMVLSTTEMVMWLDAHDGQVALSWMHGRKGENLHVESIASENGSAFLLRNSSNPKATFFHVLETILGIRSISDPYDCLVSDPPANASVLTSLSPSSFRIGYASLSLKDDPNALSLLFDLKADGQLSCRLFEEPVIVGAIASRQNNGFAESPVNFKGFHPRELVSRPVVIPTDSGLKDAEDVGVDEDMDADEDNYPLPEVQEDDEQAPFTCQRIRTRDLWNSLSQSGQEELPHVSLASLRNLLNDTEQLPSTGVLTLHELLAISCEVSTEGQETPDALKAYSLGLLSGTEAEGMQLDDLMHQSTSLLHRANLQKVELNEAVRSVDGDEELAPNANDTQERLLERYLPASAAYGRCDHTQDVEAALAMSSVQLLCDLHLSATTAWYNRKSTRGDGENDQISENLSKLSVSSKSASLHPTEYLEPICRKELFAPGTSTIKSLLGQWQFGSDPSTYAWPGLSNYRDFSPESTQETSFNPDVTRPRFYAAKQHSLTMPATIASSLQNPYVPSNSAGASLPPLKHQSQVHFETETESQTQDFASTQLVQGPFGNRNPLSFRRSLGKKRTIGF
ncbi:hypothetical protein NliqN6_4631 [Naganishia liquefaciens]|uniref:Uncharacterized protein n=1 Tax=Naganishia liquefaciens TaxID=104408 RepID=A0A8H3TW93_9TREE|nr:hypothetical protein NliqN6_4631 [Naganishia liquefaciens]